MDDPKVEFSRQQVGEPGEEINFSLNVRSVRLMALKVASQLSGARFYAALLREGLLLQAL